jgi:hypothetical protein
MRTFSKEEEGVISYHLSRIHEIRPPTNPVEASDTPDITMAAGGE